MQLQPLGCLSDRSSSFCLGCEPDQYFECETCGYLQPYCKGADDDYFEVCDDCWEIAQHMNGVTGISMGVIADDERRYRRVATWSEV